MSSEDIVNTHDTFMKSLGIELSDDEKRLPYLYWTSKLHKSPVKHRFIAGSSKCTTKQLSSLLTKILSYIQSVSWSLAEFRHNKIVQSPHENYFNVCRQHKEK